MIDKTNLLACCIGTAKRQKIMGEGQPVNSMALSLYSSVIGASSRMNGGSGSTLDEGVPETSQRRTRAQTMKDRSTADSTLSAISEGGEETQVPPPPPVLS